MTIYYQCEEENCHYCIKNDKLTREQRERMIAKHKALHKCLSDIPGSEQEQEQEQKPGQSMTINEHEKRLRKLAELQKEVRKLKEELRETKQKEELEKKTDVN